MSATYAVEPIRGQDADEVTTRLKEEAWRYAGCAPLPAIPPPVVGWRLTFTFGGNAIEQRKCSTFYQAQRDDAAWLQQHGEDAISESRKPRRRPGAWGGITVTVTPSADAGSHSNSSR